MNTLEILVNRILAYKISFVYSYNRYTISVAAQSVIVRCEDEVIFREDMTEVFMHEDFEFQVKDCLNVIYSNLVETID